MLFFRDPNIPNTWIAQALERDVAASGKSVDEARVAFEQTIRGHVLMAAKLKREPLEGLAEAPELFWSAWERATSKHQPELAHFHPSIPPAYVIQAVTDETLQPA